MNAGRSVSTLVEVAMPDANTDAATLLRVLLVDDSPWLRQSVRAALERAGVVVVGEAADGAQALTQAATHHPDLVLMDLSMPGMDGIQATQALRPRRYGRALEQVGVHAVHSVGTRQVERHDAADHQRDTNPLCGGERLVQQQHPDHGDCRGASA